MYSFDVFLCVSMCRSPYVICWTNKERRTWKLLCAVMLRRSHLEPFGLFADLVIFRCFLLFQFSAIESALSGKNPFLFAIFLLTLIKIFLQLHQKKWSVAVQSLQHAIRGYPTSADLWEVCTLPSERLHPLLYFFLIEFLFFFYIILNTWYY